MISGKACSDPDASHLMLATDLTQSQNDNDVAEVHDRNAITDMSHYRKIMGDEEIRELLSCNLPSKFMIWA
jgi:hypothetical protein